MENTPTPGTRMLAAIVFTDVVGFSALMQRNEGRALRNVERDFMSMSQVASAHGGQVLKRTGDGLLMSFYSAVEAVTAALKMQQIIAQATHLLAPEDILIHRVGIHLGDVLLTEHDVLGDGVNVAQRLQAEARPGAICLSQTVFDVVKGKVEVSPVRLGPRSLKGIIEPIVVWEVAPIGEHSTANILTKTEPKNMGDLKLNALEPDTHPARGLLTFLGIILALTVPIMLGVWVVKRTVAQQKDQAKIDAQRREERAAVKEAERNKKASESGASVPPTATKTENPPAPAASTELADPTKAEQSLEATAAELAAQLDQARNSYDFDKCQQILNQLGLDKDGQGAALSAHYAKCGQFLQFVDGGVASLPKENPLHFPGATADDETLVWGDKGLVAFGKQGSVETKALRSMSPDAILKIGRALNPSAAKDRENLRSFAREFGQPVLATDQ